MSPPTEIRRSTFFSRETAGPSCSAKRALAISTRASQSSTMYSISSVDRCQLTGVK
jgi:hypothetical protein